MVTDDYLCDSKQTVSRPAVPEIKDIDRSGKGRF